MRIQELLCEMPKDHKTTLSTDDWARSKGLQQIGTGSDARIYRSPNQTIVKVLVGSMGLNTVKASQGFLSFYKFCQRHQGHPNLPVFLTKPKNIVVNGENIIYVEMETLQRLDRRTAKIAQDMINHLGDTWEEFVELDSEKLLSQATHGMLKNPFPGEKEMWEKFYNLLTDVFNYFDKRYPPGSKHKATFDLINTDNIMQRNGVPVIIDPYVVN